MQELFQTLLVDLERPTSGFGVVRYTSTSCRHWLCFFLNVSVGEVPRILESIRVHDCSENKFHDTSLR